MIGVVYIAPNHENNGELNTLDSDLEYIMPIKQ